MIAPINPADPSGYVVRIVNRHVPECGAAPNLLGGLEQRLYVAFFEDSSGDQWTFTIDREAKVGVLRCGDLGWDVHVRITPNAINDAILAGFEVKLWIVSCWFAACGEWPDFKEMLKFTSLMDGK